MDLSFFFELYRPDREEKYFSSCLASNRIVSIGSEVKIKPLSSFLYATYMLESDNDKKTVPALYLLSYKKNYLPLPLCLYRVIHKENDVLNIIELVSTQGSFELDQ